MNNQLNEDFLKSLKIALSQPEQVYLEPVLLGGKRWKSPTREFLKWLQIRVDLAILRLFPVMRQSALGLSDVSQVLKERLVLERQSVLPCIPISLEVTSSVPNVVAN